MAATTKTFSELVAEVISGEDERRTRSFLYTYKLHATPATLLQIVQSIADLATEDPNSRKQVGNFVGSWAMVAVEDVRDKALVNKLLKLASQTMETQESNRLKLQLLKRSTTSLPKLTQGKLKQVHIMDCKASTLAKHLTMIDWQLFVSVKPAEFLGQAWQKEDRNVVAPHLTSLALRFDKVSFWVATRIVTEPTSKKQAQFIEKIIDVMLYLLKINNYNTLLQMLSGLNMSSVTRLKQAWSRVSSSHTEHFNMLDTLMSPANNYSSYRTHVKALEDKPPGPVLPYVALFLRDITFVGDANPTTLANEEINTDKMDLLGAQIQQFQNYQSCAFKFPVDNNLLYYLTNLQGTLGEDDLYSLSVKRQPLAANSNALLADDGGIVAGGSSESSLPRSMSYHGTSSTLTADSSDEDENSVGQTSSTSVTEATSDNSEDDLHSPRPAARFGFVPPLATGAATRMASPPPEQSTTTSESSPVLEDYQLLEDASGLPPGCSSSSVVPLGLTPLPLRSTPPPQHKSRIMRHHTSLTLPNMISGTTSVADYDAAVAGRRRKRSKKSLLLDTVPISSEEELDAYDILDGNDLDDMDESPRSESLSNPDGVYTIPSASASSSTPSSSSSSSSSSSGRISRRRMESPRQSMKHRFEDGSSGVVSRKQVGPRGTRGSRSASLGGDELPNLDRPPSPLSRSKLSVSSLATADDDTPTGSPPTGMLMVPSDFESDGSMPPVSPRSFKSLSSTIRNTSESIKSSKRMRELRAILSPRVTIPPQEAGSDSSSSSTGGGGSGGAIATVITSSPR